MIMKSIMTKTVLTTFAIGLLAKPLMANYQTNPDCYKIVDTEVNVKKFSKVWENLHRDSSESQNHLQKYLEESLDETKGTLDVQKFSSVWKELNYGSPKGQQHLTSHINAMLTNASQSKDCTSASLLCSVQLDTAKFTSLWNAVKIGGNNSQHLTQKLDAMMTNKVCTI